MSLYSMEEICEGCDHAHWHGCNKCHSWRRKSFCHCASNAEEHINGCDGTCPFKMVDGVVQSHAEQRDN